jgi:hypothetical protein
LKVINRALKQRQRCIKKEVAGKCCNLFANY